MTTGSIWFGDASDQLHEIGSGNMLDHVGIQFEPLGDDYIEATMPVDARTRQPMGVLHGGASLMLAETLASIGAMLTCDREKHKVFGLEINANHVRVARSGRVRGRATPIHHGRTTQVWEVKIRNENDQLICISRVTLMITSVRSGS